MRYETMESKHLYLDKSPMLVVIAALALLFGAAIYLFFRQNIIFLDFLFDDKLLDKVRIPTDCSNNIFLYFFVYCLPDALWYLALLLFQLYVYDVGLFVSRFLFRVSVALPFVLEFMQFLGVMGGVFDILDIISYVLILIIVLLWEKELKKSLFALCK